MYVFNWKMHFFATENGPKSDSVNHIPSVLQLQKCCRETRTLGTPAGAGAGASSLAAPFFPFFFFAGAQSSNETSAPVLEFLGSSGQSRRSRRDQTVSANSDVKMHTSTFYLMKCVRGKIICCIFDICGQISSISEKKEGSRFDRNANYSVPLLYQSADPTVLLLSVADEMHLWLNKLNAVECVLA